MTPPQAISDARITAAARALNRSAAKACGVNEDDSWKLYGDQYREDASAALTAADSAITALAPAPQPANDKELERRTGEPHIDGWPLYSMLPPPAPKQGEVPMPEPLSWSDLSIAEGPAYSLPQLRAYGDARAAAVREPLSDEQILEIARLIPRDDLIHDFARAIERAHGITAQAQQEQKHG